MENFQVFVTVFKVVCFRKKASIWGKGLRGIFHVLISLLFDTQTSKTILFSTHNIGFDWVMIRDIVGKRPVYSPLSSFLPDTYSNIMVDWSLPHLRSSMLISYKVNCKNKSTNRSFLMTLRWRFLKIWRQTHLLPHTNSFWRLCSRQLLKASGKRINCSLLAISNFSIMFLTRFNIILAFIENFHIFA